MRTYLFFGLDQCQRIQMSCTDLLQRTKAITEDALQFTEETALIEGRQALRVHAQASPDQSTAVFRQWQQRHRAFVGETLEGHAVVSLARGDVGDQRALVVRTLADADPKLLAQAGAATIGEHREVAFQGGFIIEGQAVAVGQRLHAGDFRRATPADHVLVQALPQALAEPGVFNDITQRWNTLFHRRQPRRRESTTVGNMNLLDRLGAAGNFLPDAQALVNLPRAKGQRRRTSVVTRLIRIPRGERLDQHDLPASGLGPGLQGQRQTRTDQPATNDCQVDSTHAACVRACAIRASISLTVFGTPPVNISQPVLVTTTSSSMRTPMPRHFFATFWLSGAI
ncbi:hypothetical protein D9M71_243300 [compost metagenome]